MQTSNAIQRRLVTWLRKQILIVGKKGPCTRLQLHHVGTSGKLGTEICNIVVGENKEKHDPLTGDDVEGYAGEMLEEASNYAEGLNATQTFAIAAYFEEDDSRPMARTTFTVRVEQEADDNEVASEPADMHGLMKQLMRHNEAQQKLNVMALSSALTTLKNQNEMLGTMVTDMLAQRVEQIETVEELATARHAREIELQKEASATESKAQLMKQVVALLPAMANKVMGKRVLPENDPVVHQIVKFGEALTPRDIEAMFNGIESPITKAAFAQLLDTIKDKVGDSTAETPPNNTAS